MERNHKLAMSYARTSTTVNSDGDSEPRQRKATESFAARAGITIVGHEYDVVTGTSEIEARPAFNRLLKSLEASTIGVVIVEDVSRFARESLAGQLGIAKLHAMGVKLLSAKDGRDYANPANAMEKFQIGLMLGIAELEKSTIVERLQSGRRSRLAATGWCGGFKVADEVKSYARSLHAAGRSLRAIGAELAERGWISETGRPFGPSSVKLMVE